MQTWSLHFYFFHRFESLNVLYLAQYCAIYMCAIDMNYIYFIIFSKKVDLKIAVLYTFLLHQ